MQGFAFGEEITWHFHYPLSKTQLHKFCLGPYLLVRKLAGKKKKGQEKHSLASSEVRTGFPSEVGGGF